MQNHTHKVGILGSGDVAKALALGFLAHGHSVQLGSRSPEKLREWQAQSAPAATLGTFPETAAGADLVVLAVKGPAAAAALEQAGAENLAGKTVIDAANPISDAPPVEGVLPFFTDFQSSLMERLQEQFPAARFVKAFNSVGSALMVQPQLPGGPPTMFYCGNDEAAKAQVRSIIEQFGWEPADMGGAIAARALEPLCILWCLPGFRQNQWRHAFKLLRA